MPNPTLTEHLPAIEETSDGYPHYHFVLCKHTIDNIPKIARALEGCDTVLVETVGVEPEYAADLFGMFNAFTDSTIPHEEVSDIVQRNLQRSEDASDHFVLVLASELYGSNKILAPVDVLKTHPVFEQLVRGMQQIKQVTRYTARGGIATDQIVQELREALTLQAETDRKREGVVASQLLEYPEYLPHGYGKHIGVVQGAAHTGTYQILSRLGLPVSREFIDTLPYASGVHMTFPWAVMATRQKRFKPDSLLPDALLRYVLLESILVQHVALPPSDGTHEVEFDETLNILRAEVIEAMPEIAQRNFLNSWEKIMLGSAKGRRRKTRMLVQRLLETYIKDSLDPDE
ncbi:MAG TPA: hypothetical protein VHD60_00235 [Candidatus Saccharimonadales bacterium]|nr:hypothetical protein [Candidatus Saccharimonadales bacterium]